MRIRRRPCKGSNGPWLERAAACRLALHSLERTDAHPCSDLAHVRTAYAASSSGTSLERCSSFSYIALLSRLRGPKFGTSFEWPAHCDGWSKSCPEIQNLIRELPVRCMFDGCAYSFRSRHGAPLKKLWRVQFSCPRRAALLSNRCPGPRAHLLHERTSGREAKRSERYAPLIVKRLAAGLLAPSTRRAIVEHSGRS